MTDASQEVQTPIPLPGLTPGQGNLLDFKKEKDPRLAVIVGSGPSLIGFDRSQLDKGWIYPIVINDEYARAEGVFRPGCWVFNDPQFLVRQIENGFEPYDDTPIVMSEMVLHEFFQKSRSLPPWCLRAAVYRNGTRSWEPESGMFLMRRTTATAALCFAHWMGFGSAVLLGVDCFFRPDGTYYHDGSTKTAVSRKRSVVPVTEKTSVTDKHLEMVADMTLWSERLKIRHRSMEVFQCSLESPLSCFPKMTWEAAVRAFGR